MIASADKDLLALVNDRVEVHSIRTGKRLGPDEVEEKLGVRPGLVVDYLTLVGDASDNIKGAKGIGPKTAAGILDYFGSVDEVYAAIDVGSASNLKPAQLASLEELRPRLEAVRKLVRMRTDVPLDIEAVFKPRVPKVVETFMEADEMDDTREFLADTAKLLDDALAERGRRMEKAAVPPDEPKPEPVKPATPLHEDEWRREENLIRQATRTIAQKPKPAAPVAVVEQPAPGEWDRSLDPRSMHEACLLAKRLHEARMFSSYGNPQAVLSTVLLGRELGLPAMASLRSVHIIEGKHSLSADLMVALVLKSGLAEYFQVIETTDKICTYETKAQGRAAAAATQLHNRTGGAGWTSRAATPRQKAQPLAHNAG